ncbi:MCE family protein [Gordonia aichiensis]
MKTTSTAVKAVLFVVVTSLAALFVAVLAGNLRFGPTRDYHAIFSTAAGLTTGSEVRIAGVPVGTVTGVELADKDAARVDFTLDTAHTLSDTTHAVIRYKNLIGDRYLQLTEPDAIGQPESEGSTIPEARTTPALDVDQVVNGFKPLLQGLDPAETNRVATSLVAVLNGQESAISELTSALGVVTNSLADHDAAIGKVIENFNVVLAGINSRHDATDQLLTGLAQLVSSLSADSPRISGALTKIDALTASLADVVTSVRPDLAESISGLNKLSGNLNASTDTLQLILTKLPEAYRIIGRVSGFGSYVNFFVCGLAIKYGPGQGDQTPMFTAPAGRCQP